VTFRDIVGIEPASSCSGELVFAHDPFMPVQLALYPVLENAGRFRQQTDDFEAPPDLNPLVSIG